MGKKQANGLTERMNRYVEEYQFDLNATRAAIRAGYSPKTARQQAHLLMKDPRIKKALKHSRDAWADRVGIRKEVILQELAKIGFANINAFVSQDTVDGDVIVDLSAATPDQMASLASIEVTTTLSNNGKDSTTETTKKVIKLHDKRQALETIAKHLGMFTDTVEVDFKAAAVPIIFNAMPAKGDVRVTKDE